MSAKRKPRSRTARRLVAAVQSLAEARAALASGRAAGATVVLVSPPNAAAYLGVGFFWALVEAARADEPGVAVEAVIDCGDDPGWALAALRTGFKSIVLGGHPGARRRVAAIAKRYGGRVLARRPRPVAKAALPV